MYYCCLLCNIVCYLSRPPYGNAEVTVSVDKHWQNIMYCNFIIKSVVSESAILTFCIDVLSMIGLMTADDLGKRLNEASRVPQLMVALKDQVGGLKEFLKRFPDVFVFSFEHPYNPHIFLRIVLSPDLQAEVENGVLPVKFLSQIIAKVNCTSNVKTITNTNFILEIIVWTHRSSSPQSGLSISAPQGSLPRCLRRVREPHQQRAGREGGVRARAQRWWGQHVAPNAVRH